MSALAWHRDIVETALPAPATLLLGEVGDGRDLLALALAASFAGTDANAEPKSFCAQLVAHKKSSGKEWFMDQNADVLSVSPDGGIIPVDAARRIVEFCSLAPIALARRVAVVLSAECMNAAAANALLKTLEEPAKDKALILAARASSLLPPTIISRCRIIVAPPPDRQEATEWAEQKGADQHMLAFSGGMPLAAQEAKENWQQICDAVDHFGKGSRMNIHSAAADLAKFDGWLDCLQKWVSDGCRATSGLSARYFPASEQQFVSLCQHPVRWLNCHHMLSQKRQLASHPLAADLFIKETLHEFRNMFVD